MIFVSLKIWICTEFCSFWRSYCKLSSITVTFPFFFFTKFGQQLNFNLILYKLYIWKYQKDKLFYNINLTDFHNLYFILYQSSLLQMVYYYILSKPLVHIRRQKSATAASCEYYIMCEQITYKKVWKWGKLKIRHERSSWSTVRMTA